MCSGLEEGAPPCNAPPRKGEAFLYYLVFLISYFLFLILSYISYFLYFLISYFLFLKIVVDCAAQCTTPPRKGGALLRSGKRRTTAATETEIGKGHIFIFQIITNSEKKIPYFFVANILLIVLKHIWSNRNRSKIWKRSHDQVPNYRKGT